MHMYFVYTYLIHLLVNNKLTIQRDLLTPYTFLIHKLTSYYTNPSNPSLKEFLMLPRYSGQLGNPT